MEEPDFENLDSFFYNNGDHNADAIASASGGTAYYLPTVGITNLKLCEPNELIFDQATIFFRILDAFKIPYALFAGSSIGLLRNQKTLPFVDDYDIIIFNKHKLTIIYSMIYKIILLIKLILNSCTKNYFKNKLKFFELIFIL